MTVRSAASDFRLHLGRSGTMSSRDVSFLLGFGLYLVFLSRLFLGTAFKDDTSGNDLVNVISSKLCHRERAD